MVKMLMQNKIEVIHKRIMFWYRKYGRHDLPWRKTVDIYHIAIAEIMLQQTNVPKVIEKYTSFLKRFPTITRLAQASQKDVITQWQGLGYNRRAIYVHKMAQKIVKDFQGIFPNEPEVLMELSGIGAYTSRSILIFARNHDVATCDVNIARIMRRLHKKKSASEKQVIQWTEKFLYQGHSRDWHNALMDFASIICTKRAPQCLQCPLGDMCFSFPNPQDEKKTARKEIGRSECDKHVPRRIFRGRIVEFLRQRNGTVNDIGQAIKKDWHEANDHEWCKNVLEGLKKDQMVLCKNDVWMLK
jgi:A/G-specific adenine glycosylase